MELYATSEPNNTIAKRLEVYDKEGLAHIIKTLQNDRIMEWTSPNRTPAEWVALNNGPRYKAGWTFVYGGAI